jgi:hypothetical protein
MKISLPVVLAAAFCTETVAAINIVFYTGGSCSNAAGYACVLQGQDRCCDSSRFGTFNSMEFQDLPSSPDWELRSHGGGGCSRLTARTTIRGRSEVCFNREPPYTGGGWGGRSGRRDVVSGDASAECDRPQELWFEDGTRFDLTSLSDAEYELLTSLELETPDDLSEEFQQFKIEA